MHFDSLSTATALVIDADAWGFLRECKVRDIRTDKVKLNISAYFVPRRDW